MSNGDIEDIKHIENIENSKESKAYEKNKQFLEKLEQPLGQYLYIAVGAIAVLAALPGVLRAPYDLEGAVWAIIIAGSVAIVSIGVLRQIANSYFRELALKKQEELVKSYDDGALAVRIGRGYWVIQIIATIALGIQVTAFAVFVLVNMPNALYEKPKIVDLVATPPSIEPGGVVNLRVETIDRDQDHLNYIWSSPVGRFLDNDQPTVTWIAPREMRVEEGELVRISVQVSDGDGDSSSDTEILVRGTMPLNTRIGEVCDLLEGFAGLRVLGSDLDCSPLSNFIEAGVTESNKELRADLLKSELLAEISADKGDPERPKRCCSISVWSVFPLPILCDPSC